MGDIKWEGGETATAQLTSIIPTLVAGPRSRNAPESWDCSDKEDGARRTTSKDAVER